MANGYVMFVVMCMILRLAIPITALQQALPGKMYRKNGFALFAV